LFCPRKLRVGSHLLKYSDNEDYAPALSRQYCIGETISNQAFIPNGCPTPTINCFWLQLDLDDVEDILARITLLTQQKKFHVSSSFSPNKGKLCLAFWSERGWWARARVEAEGSIGAVVVRFVDFGNTSEVEIKNLKDISDNLRKLPPLAVKCALDGASQLPQYVSDRFQELVGSKSVKAIFESENHAGDGTLNVRLFPQFSNEAETCDIFGLPYTSCADISDPE